MLKAKSYPLVIRTSLKTTINRKHRLKVTPKQNGLAVRLTRCSPTAMYLSYNSSRGGTRTPDPVINSHLLYHLSYSGIATQSSNLKGSNQPISIGARSK